MKTIFKLTFSIIFVSFLINNTLAQPYKFTDKVNNETTCVKNQYRSGTCWSFSTLSFIESELIRMGKGAYDLSEMYIVNKCYKDKADLYVRMHGNLNFGGGGAFHDIIHVMKHYGLMPEEAYDGLKYGTDKHIHGEMDEILKSIVTGVVKNKNKKLSPNWKKTFGAVVDSYLGEVPEKFTYKGKEYTPRSFANELGLNADDYIEFSSFTHHPFYEKFIIEVPDNWLWDEVYNVPLNELEEIMDYALKNGYTIGWGADVSHKGFSYNNGIAVIPETNIENMDGLEKDKWEKLSQKERQKRIYDFDNIVTEKTITQEMRQESYDNYETTDDHGMHIVGISYDQKGNKFYKVKNSWGESGKYNGYFYASKAFILMQTMDFMVHKDGVPKHILNKINLK